MSFSKISEKQRYTLIECLKNSPELLSGKFNANFTYKNAEEKWNEISVVLNSIPGPNKTWKNWRKTWQDLRSRTKSKHSKQKKYVAGTGGGPKFENPINATEEEILQLIKPVCLDGHNNVNELVAIIEYNSVENEAANNQIQKNYTENLQMDVNAESNDLTNANNIVQPSATPRTIPRRGSTKLKNSKAGLESYEDMLKKKLETKETYYNKKLQLLQEKNNLISENGKGIISELQKITGILSNMTNSIVNKK